MIKQKKFLFNNTSNVETLFFNTCFDKNQLKNLIAWILDSYGEKSTIDFLEKLKQVGFHEATQAGVSLGLEDLQIPAQKAGLIAHSLLETNYVNTKSFAGNMTGVEKSQQMIDIWNQMSETLRQNAVQNFRNTNPVNPVFMMAFSGARGNISQVRQLVAMRGLMADPQGAILEFPIESNFREGLTITEYLISCYGARKGLVDTALRTATSGYLTRRLVDAVQHIVVTMSDCKTSKGVFVKKNLESRLIGRVLAENLLIDKNKLIEKNQIISPKLSKIIASSYTKVLVRSPLTCAAHKSICQLCYGADLAHGILVNIGEAVGVIAAQSIGEPGTQLTMRTFHTGGVGVFSDQATKPIFSPFDGTVEFPEELIGHFVRTPHGNILYMVKYLPLTPTRIVLKIKPIESSQSFYVVQEQELPAGSLLLVRQNEFVKAGQLVAQSSQIKTSKQEMPESTHPIKSPIDGEIFFESMLIWTHKNLPVKTKKQKIKENSNLPDIQTLGQLGSFWVFSSYNQHESQCFNTFLRPGDLVTPESFLFNYHFKISQKTQLKIIGSKLLIGQTWNQIPVEKVRFHKFGYSLNVPFSLVKKSTNNFLPFLEQSSSKNSVQEDYPVPKRIQKLEYHSSQTIFYIKNSTGCSKKQFLIWFPSQNSRLESQTEIFGTQTKNSEKQLKQDWLKTYSGVWQKNFHLQQLSYLSILKNYSLKQYFGFAELPKIDCFGFARPKNFTSKFYVFKFRKNNFTFFDKKNYSIETPTSKTSQTKVTFENRGSFHFFYKQRLFHAQRSERSSCILSFQTSLTGLKRQTNSVPDLFMNKKYNIKTKFGIKNLVPKTSCCPVPKLHSNLRLQPNLGKEKKENSKKYNFLLKTLTKTKVSIYEKLNKNNNLILTPKTNWIYVPVGQTLEKKFDERNNSKFIFLEQGKKIDNFLFSNLQTTFQTIHGPLLKVFASRPKNHVADNNFGYSTIDLLNSISIQLAEQLSRHVVIINQNCSKETSSSTYKIFFFHSFNLQKEKKFKTKKIHRLVIFSTKKEKLFSEKSSSSSWLYPKYGITNQKIQKSGPAIVFYKKNKTFLFLIKNNIEPRVVLRLETLQKVLKVPTFFSIAKVSEQSFFNQTELKNQWTTLQAKNHQFHIKSPLISKQNLTLFLNQKESKIKIQPLTLNSSGWSFGQKTFRVNLTFELKSKFVHTRTNLKLTNNRIQCKPPVTSFSLFFYDFLSFETKQQFHFKTFLNGWALPNQTITEGFLKLKTTGEFRRFENSQNESFSSILKFSDLITLKSNCLTEKQFRNLTIGQIIRWGQEISPQTASSYNGRVITLKKNFLVLRLGIPFLASARGILHVNHSDLIQKNNLLVTLKSRRLQTEDIVQGIPKIEQLFEARETQGGEILSNNVHILLQNYFVEALKHYPLSIAVSKSVNQIQRFLIDNILDAYLNQGVKISEKHVEIVVRQMTTKVRILNGGYTGLVQGEIVQLTWIQEVNKKLRVLDLEQATYEPIVLGISKSVLQSESFLLAASFQEVSRVLVRSALSRKTDFLRGLHENVILGQLIPAGTGLLLENPDQINSYRQSSVSLNS